MALNPPGWNAGAGIINSLALEIKRQHTVGDFSPFRNKKGPKTKQVIIFQLKFVPS